MKNNEELNNYLLNMRKMLQKKLTKGQASTVSFDRTNVEIALISGAISSEPEIGYDAYYYFLNKTSHKVNESREQKQFLLFLIFHGIFDTYPHILPTCSNKDIIDTYRRSAIDNNAESFINSCKLFGKRLRDIAGSGHGDQQMPIYLYLNSVFVQSQRAFFIDNILKKFPLNSGINNSWDRQVIRRLRDNSQTLSVKWQELIHYVMHPDNQYHRLYQIIVSQPGNLLKHCSFANMILFLAGNRQQDFCLKEVANLIQLQMIRYSLQQEMQEPMEESLLDNDWRYASRGVFGFPV